MMFERPGRTQGKGGPSAYAGDPVFAVRPGPSGEVVHLAIAGYQPGKKSRSAYFEQSGGLQTLCAPGHAHQELCVPLSVAAQWPRFDPGGVVHANGGGSWRWCRACLGHLVEIRGLQDLVVNHAVPGRARARKPAHMVYDGDADSFLAWADPVNVRRDGDALLITAAGAPAVLVQPGDTLRREPDGTLLKVATTRNRKANQ